MESDIKDKDRERQGVRKRMGNRMNKRLHILWTSNNPDTAHLMVFMYAINALTKGWWDEVTIIVWGASAKLVAENESIQDKIHLALHQGVKVSACIACASQLGVVDELLALGLEVIPWGQPLTDLMQNGAHILSV